MADGRHAAVLVDYDGVDGNSRRFDKVNVGVVLEWESCGLCSVRTCLDVRACVVRERLLGH